MYLYLHNLEVKKSGRQDVFMSNQIPLISN